MVLFLQKMASFQSGSFTLTTDEGYPINVTGNISNVSDMECKLKYEIISIFKHRMKIVYIVQILSLLHCQTIWHQQHRMSRKVVSTTIRYQFLPFLCFGILSLVHKLCASHFSCFRICVSTFECQVCDTRCLQCYFHSRRYVSTW